MVEILNKLEFMLMGLRQMNLGSVCAWFPQAKREDLINAIKSSPKFKLEDGVVSLKSETEIYEEELQKDILKDLMGDSNETKDILEQDDEFSSFDDDLELIEEVVSKPEEIQDAEFVEQANPIQDLEPTISEVVVENVVKAKVVEEVIEIENIVEDIQAIEIETVEAHSNVNKKGGIATKKTPKVEETIEVEETIQKPIEVNNLDGAMLSYETILKLIGEYNNSIEKQLNYSVENRYEVREKAIKTFYKNKYNVRIKEEGIINSNANIYGLVNRKKGMEVAYLVICDILNDSILNYILDNYDDEVVYFCPIDGVDVDFEVGLNEFYLKDTDIIFDKYLEHYVIVEEADKKIKKMEIIVGTH